MPTACIRGVAGSLPFSLALLRSWKHHSIYQGWPKSFFFFKPTVNCTNLCDSSSADTGPLQCHLSICWQVCIFSSVQASYDAARALPMFFCHPPLCSGRRWHHLLPPVHLLVTCRENMTQPLLPSFPGVPAPLLVTCCNVSGDQTSCGALQYCKFSYWSNTKQIQGQ